jgi:cyclin-dependent kinase regulatory subunit CKS1
MSSSAIDPTRRNRVPRLLSDKEKEKLEEFVDLIHYSSRLAALLYQFQDAILLLAMLLAKAPI